MNEIESLKKQIEDLQAENKELVCCLAQHENTEEFYDEELNALHREIDRLSADNKALRHDIDIQKEEICCLKKDNEELRSELLEQQVKLATGYLGIISN